MILNKGADGHLYGHQTLHGFGFTQWNDFVKDQGIIITKSGRMHRKESNAFRKMEGAVRDQGIKITYS